MKGNVNFNYVRKSDIIRIVLDKLEFLVNLINDYNFSWYFDLNYMRDFELKSFS